MEVINTTLATEFAKADIMRFGANVLLQRKITEMGEQVLEQAAQALMAELENKDSCAVNFTLTIE